MLAGGDPLPDDAPFRDRDFHAAKLATAVHNVKVAWAKRQQQDVKLAELAASEADPPVVHTSDARPEDVQSVVQLPPAPPPVQPAIWLPEKNSPPDLPGVDDAPQSKSSMPTPVSTPVPLCTIPPGPQTFIAPAPMPTSTSISSSTPMSVLSADDVAHGLCETADALDPVMPDPSTVGGPDVGDIIDQAYIAQQNIPYGSAPPLFESLIRVPITIIKVFKDGPSTIVNFVCQQRDKSGPYYDLFPIDQKMQSVKNWWREKDTKQKALVIGMAILTLLIAIPLLI